MNRQGKNGIPWCDYTWSPITGCSPVSVGCQNCFAAAISKRFHLPWGKPHVHWDRFADRMPKEPARIFVGSMTDLFHENVDDWEGERRKSALKGIWDVIAANPQHTFILLTKRPLIMMIWMYTQKYMPNLWLGVTAENQAMWNQRVPVLTRIHAAVKFVSVEPMLEKIDVNTTHQPSWVICGPENGRGARPCDPEWIVSLSRQCQQYGVPFFDKSEPPLRREYPKGRE